MDYGESTKATQAQPLPLSGTYVEPPPGAWGAGTHPSSSYQGAYQGAPPPPPDAYHGAPGAWAPPALPPGAYYAVAPPAAPGVPVAEWAGGAGSLGAAWLPPPGAAAPVGAPWAAPAAASLPAPQAVHLDAFDGIRAIAALLVVLGHTTWYFASDAVSDRGDFNALPVSRWPVVGIEFLSPVTLFFVLSGFTLAAVYDSAAPHGSFGAPHPIDAAPGGRLAFCRRRAARLAPVYYVSLLFALPGLIIYSPVHDVATSVPIALLWLQSWSIGQGQSWNGPLWTCSAFLLQYATFPWALVTFRAMPTDVLLRTVAALCAASIVLVVVWLTNFGVNGAAFVLHSFAPFRLLHFFAGVGAGLLARRPDAAAAGAHFTYAAPRARCGGATALADGCSALLACNLALCAALSAVAPYDGTNLGVQVVYMYIAEFTLPVVFVSWLYALARPDCGARTKAALSSRPLRALGTWSFCLYCFHWPTLQWLAWAVHGGVSAAAVPRYSGLGVFVWFGAFPGWATPLLALPCVAVAALAHRVLEAPARKALAPPRLAQAPGGA